MTKADDQKTIEVTFPADYASKEVAGKVARFEVKVHSVSAPVLPELNDDFAAAFGIGDGGFESFQQEVRDNMQRELDATIKSKAKQQVFDGLLERADIEVPGSLVDSEIEALIKNQADDAEKQSGSDRSAFEDEARRRVSLGLLIGRDCQT